MTMLLSTIKFGEYIGPRNNIQTFRSSDLEEFYKEDYPEFEAFLINGEAARCEFNPPKAVGCLNKLLEKWGLTERGWFIREVKKNLDSVPYKLIIEGDTFILTNKDPQ